MKVAIIGAGSIVFAKALLNDMLATPSLQDAEYALMSRTEPKLRRMEAFATYCGFANIKEMLAAIGRLKRIGGLPCTLREAGIAWVATHGVDRTIRFYRAGQEVAGNAVATVSAVDGREDGNDAIDSIIQELAI